MRDKSKGSSAEKEDDDATKGNAFPFFRSSSTVAAPPPTNFLRGLPLISGGARFYRLELEP